MIGDTVGMIAMMVLGGIVCILGLLILTGKVPLPGGIASRIIFGLLSLGGGAYILLEVAQA